MPRPGLSGFSISSLTQGSSRSTTRRGVRCSADQVKAAQCHARHRSASVRRQAAEGHMLYGAAFGREQAPTWARGSATKATCWSVRQDKALCAGCPPLNPLRSGIPHPVWAPADVRAVLCAAQMQGIQPALGQHCMLCTHANAARGRHAQQWQEVVLSQVGHPQGRPTSSTRRTGADVALWLIDGKDPGLLSQAGPHSLICHQQLQHRGTEKSAY